MFNELRWKYKSVNHKFDETKVNKKLKPSVYCTEVAYQKAKSISKEFNSNYIVGSDTIVYINKKMIKEDCIFSDSD